MSTEPAAKPDGRRARGDRKRQVVFAHALAIAATDGLEGLTLGRVALAAGVPKSTLQTLFGDREGLQIQVLEFGAEAFAEALRRRLPDAQGAFGRLSTLCDAWFDLVGGCELPGGCPVTAATGEFRARDGRVAQVVAEHRERWRSALLGAVNVALAEKELAPEVDAEQLVFEILAFQGAANLAAGKAGDANFMRAWRAVQSLLQHSRRGHPRERDVADLSSTEQLSSQFD